MKTKADFRKELLEARKAMSAEERHVDDMLIAEKLCGLSAFEQAEIVMTFLSFGDEVDTRGIIKRSREMGKTVLLPRCVEGSREMRWYEIEGPDQLETSSFGMDEPRPDLCREVAPEEYNRSNTIAIVPGLAFDVRGYRIGYGGGFYDTFLAGFTGISIGLCRTPFLFDAIKNIDRHDLPVDIVVTPVSVVA